MLVCMPPVPLLIHFCTYILHSTICTQQFAQHNLHTTILYRAICIQQFTHNNLHRQEPKIVLIELSDSRAVQNNTVHYKTIQYSKGQNSTVCWRQFPRPFVKLHFGNKSCLQIHFNSYTATRIQQFAVTSVTTICFAVAWNWNLNHLCEHFWTYLCEATCLKKRSCLQRSCTKLL